MALRSLAKGGGSSSAIGFCEGNMRHDVTIIGLLLAMLVVLLLATTQGTVSGQAGVAIQPFTYPDITGAASTTQLSATLGCSSVQILAPSANSASVRWGDSSTSSTRGGVIAAGGGQYLPPAGSNYYPLSSLYVYVATGDKLQFVCFR
jgi:hypothetical protein